MRRGPLTRSAESLFTDDAVGITAWLDTATRMLNPHGELHHRVSCGAMQQLFEEIPPPPPLLQERWATLVWQRPEEPFVAYLVRCLAHHFSLTKLSPHMALSGGQHRSQGLTAEHCVVVALRTRPSHTDLVQSGWDAQPCPHCRARGPAANDGDNADGNRPAVPSTGSCGALVLPLHYGGEVCARCGQPFPLVPAWTRQHFLVVERHDGTRMAAVAMGDGLAPLLSPGQPVHALLYLTRTDSQEPVVVLHAAELPVDGAGLDAQLPRGLVRGSALSSRSLGALCQCVGPRTVGQEPTKALLLLAAVHALYRRTRVARRPPAHWRPLHVLLVGPTKSGKSALLRAAAGLYGPLAQLCGATVVHGARGGSFDECLPLSRDGLALCGAAVSEVALVVDDMAAGGGASSHRLLQLQQLLEDGVVCAPARGGGGGAAVAAASAGAAALAGAGAGAWASAAAYVTRVQLIAGMHEESRLVPSLLPHFSLVALVSPRLSLAHSAAIGHDVIAASLARSSRSRASSTASSRSREGSRSASTATDGTTDRTDGGPRALDVGDLYAAVAAAPDAAWLESAVADGPYMHFFADRLSECAGLCAAAAAPGRCQTLPPPPSTRGRTEAVLDGAAVPSPVQRARQLRTLCALVQARLVLFGSAAAQAPWQETATEVWELFAYHLRSSAGQRDRAPPPPAGPTTDLATMLRLSPHSRYATDAAARGGAAFGESGAEAGMRAAAGLSAAAGGKRARGKKATRLLLVELMQREQQRRTGGGEAVCPFARADALFLSLGGTAATGGPMELVMSQLQTEGLIIRRPGGWRVTGV